ncbi:hypothetical protein MNB_SV-13-1489 [hydrothermal vent metagenome]|uniref:Helix-turn-helix domain-containing protein n=1 Tax=hydrothermal vent metagenome TaxID=652676 RepID=A0A1W1D0U7_9ZZZZ
MKQDKLFRVKEVAEYLAIGKSTAWYLSKKGLLHPIKLSERVTVWKQSDLDAFIASRIDEVEK